MSEIKGKEPINSSAHSCFIVPEHLPPDFLDALFLSVPQRHIHVKLVYKNGRLFVAITAHNREVLREWMKGIEGHSCEVLCG